MKTSFYFVLWILIYPILGLLNNNFIDNNAFLIALVIVWGLSWLLNRVMPNTLAYERALEVGPILEDVYNGNVESFRKRLSRNCIVEGITGVYFCVTLIVIALAVFTLGVNDWIALIIFAFFAYGAVSRSIKYVKSYYRLKANPVPEECVDIADNTYNFNYSSYYEDRQKYSYEQMFSNPPKHFKAFLVFSLIMAVIASILGIVLIILAIWIAVVNSSLEAKSVAIMYFLYGSLAAYFGVTDSFSIASQLKRKLTSVS